LRRRRRGDAFGALIVPAFVIFSVLLVVLLPIIAPALVVTNALEIRRLARTRCQACGVAIGLAEVRRAKEEAGARNAATIADMIRRGFRSRVATNWTIVCRGCGQGYIYAVNRQGLVAVDLANEAGRAG
jgi:hypothetical protein